MNDEVARNADFGFGTERPLVRIQSPRQKQQNPSLTCEVTGNSGNAGDAQKGRRRLTRAVSLAERIEAQTDKSGGPGACWLWTGCKQNRGYGVVGRDGKLRLAHRCLYELTKGPIPVGLQLDHLCRNPACVNPAHLEPVTNRENCIRGVSPNAVNARKTHCKYGHPFDEANTQRVGATGRNCRACRGEWYRNNRERALQSQRDRRARNKAASSAQAVSQ